MATFKSDIAAATSGKGDNRVDGRLGSGKLRNLNATVTLAGSEVGGDNIELADVPTGSIIDLAQSFIVAENPGTTFEVILRKGDLTNLTTDIVLSAGGKVDVDTDGGLVTIGAGEESLDLLVTSAAGLTADASIRVCLAFVDYN